MNTTFNEALRGSNLDAGKRQEIANDLEEQKLQRASAHSPKEIEVLRQKVDKAASALAEASGRLEARVAAIDGLEGQLLALARLRATESRLRSLLLSDEQTAALEDRGVEYLTLTLERFAPELTHVVNDAVAQLNRDHPE